jgi:hypothetical protein
MEHLDIPLLLVVLAIFATSGLTSCSVCLLRMSVSLIRLNRPLHLPWFTVTSQAVKVSPNSPDALLPKMLGLPEAVRSWGWSHSQSIRHLWLPPKLTRSLLELSCYESV